MLNLKPCLLMLAAAATLFSCSSTKDAELTAGDAGGAVIIEENAVVNKAATTTGKKETATTGQLSPVMDTSPADPPVFTPRTPGIRISSVSVPQNVVALTYDDGPHPTLTPRLLDILDRHNVKVTFFVLGQNVRRYPDIVRRAAAAGHEIASHSYDHPLLSKCSQEKVIDQLDRTERVIMDTIGKRPAVLRPPYGGLTTNQQQWIYNKYGYRIIMWNVDPLDWKKPGASVVASRLVNGAKPGGILLAHDIHPGTIDATEATLNGLKAKGFRLVTVSQLISMGRTAAQTQATHPPAAEPVAASN